MSNRQADAQNSIESKLGQLNETTQVNYEQLAERCHKLDLKFTEENDAIDAHCKELEDQLAAMNAKMQGEMKERNDAQEEKMERDYQYLVGQITDLDAKFSQADADVNEQLSTGLANFDKDLMAKAKAMETVIKANHAQLSELCEAINQKATEDKTALDVKFSDKCGSIGRNSSEAIRPPCR